MCAYTLFKSSQAQELVDNTAASVDDADRGGKGRDGIAGLSDGSGCQR